MEVNIAMASRKAVMLLKAVMVVLIATTTATTASDTSTAAAAASSSTSSHALKLFAIPSLTTATRWLFEAVQVAR
jgi:maltose-binding protein MalE